MNGKTNKKVGTVNPVGSIDKTCPKGFGFSKVKNGGKQDIMCGFSAAKKKY